MLPISPSSPKVVGIAMGWLFTNTMSDVLGLAVANMRLLKAFVQYSKVDRWHIFLPSAVYANMHAKCRDFLEHIDRTHVIDKVEFFRDYDIAEQMATTSYWAFQVGDPFLGEWLRLREGVSPRLFPITGITHSLDILKKSVWREEVELSPYTAADSAICTCKAAKLVMQRMAHTLVPEGSMFEQNLSVIPLPIEDPYESLPQGSTREEAKKRIGVPADRPLVLILGRITILRKADLQPLLVAIKLIKDRWPPDKPNPMFLIAGSVDLESPYLLSLGQRAHELGLDEWVLFRLNFEHTERPYLLAAADVFVSVPDSIQETFGLAPAEAMMVGCPIVISDWAGYREHIEDGKEGYLVPTYWGQTDPYMDFVSFVAAEEATLRISQSIVIDLEILAKRIETLLLDEPLRSRMGEAARKTAHERYAWPTIVAQYEKLWEELNQKAAQCTWAGPTMQPSGFYHNLIYMNYPTHFLDFDQHVGLTELGLDLSHLERLFSFYPRVTYWFDLQGLRSVVQSLSQSTKTIHQMATELNAAQGDIMQRTLWLMKHGIVQLQPKV